ncbi:hypothetical protein [Roseimaritima ulvae]|uniref:PEP-CTERM protein-sorting domain-containing protein n=1 Tax=Roseimaritima ulvae TaxID=980254 RepID=A0A5B9R495_9BACT|nr:hypothetical protein [Roseimaritima ulvae]QEG41241.1 hypothetical protein UC8_32600 [Roseimaritima ulvae]
MNQRLLFLLFLISHPVAAKAGLIIKGHDTTIQVGGTTTVDFTIESDSVDFLQAINFSFGITTAGPTRLEFVSPQSDLQLLDGSYVFAGDSHAADSGFPVGFVGTAATPNDTYSGGDFTCSFFDVAVDGTAKLLVRLEVTTQTTLPLFNPVAGDTFTITMAEPNTDPFQPDFSDSFGIVVPVLPPSSTGPSSDFTATVTVVNAVNAVPEPASVLVWTLIGGLGVVAGRRRTNKQAVDLID